MARATMPPAPPGDWLDHFDTVHRHNGLLLERITELLQQYEWRLNDPPPQRDTNVVMTLARTNLEDWLSQPYDHLRLRIFNLCIRKQIGPDFLSGVLPDTPAIDDRNNRSLPHALYEDRPLRLACWAQKLFWCR